MKEDIEKEMKDRVVGIEVSEDDLRGMEEEEEEEMEEMFVEDKVIIEKTLKKAKRLIDDVCIVPELVYDEECDKCHHQRPKLIKMSALIGLKAKDGIVLDVWWQQYCLECLSKLTGSPIKIADAHNSMYV